MARKPGIYLSLVPIVVAALFFCCHFSTGCDMESLRPAYYKQEFLSLHIESPDDGDTLKSNLIKVTGAVSPHEATVLVNGIAARIDNVGEFFVYIDLKEGDNVIKAVANLAGTEATIQLNVLFDPPLVLIVDSFHGEKGVDYTVTPAEICGYVSDQAARVTVNEMPVNVKKDGTYCKSLMLKEGTNYVNVVATSGDKSDTIREEIIVTQNGEAFSTPRMGEATLSNIPTIKLKANETKFIDIELWSGNRDIPRPRELQWDICRVSKLYGEEQLTMPGGLDVHIEPAVFTVHPGRVYSSTIVASAMSDIAPGQYYFRLSTMINNGPAGWFSIIVENEY
jgi:hypothetical protein